MTFIPLAGLSTGSFNPLTIGLGLPSSTAVYQDHSLFSLNPAQAWVASSGSFLHSHLFGEADALTNRITLQQPPEPESAHSSLLASVAVHHPDIAVGGLAFCVVVAGFFKFFFKRDEDPAKRLDELEKDLAAKEKLQARLPRKSPALEKRIPEIKAEIEELKARLENMPPKPKRNRRAGRHPEVQRAIETDHDEPIPWPAPKPETDKKKPAPPEKKIAPIPTVPPAEPAPDRAEAPLPAMPVKWPPKILSGPVDLDRPIPVTKSSANADLGATAVVTTQGVTEIGPDGKRVDKTNEDLVLTMWGARGERHILNIDGMSTPEYGDTAAMLLAEGFQAEMERSGDRQKAWQLGNAAVRRFNGMAGTVHGNDWWPLHANFDHAVKAARDFIADPVGQAAGPMTSGPGAVAVCVTIHPPQGPDGSPTIEHEWVGDARAKHFRRGADGKLRLIFSTVDEGIPYHPGVLKAGKDFAIGGGGRMLAASLHNLANITLNAAGMHETAQVKKTSDGEIPDTASETGAKPAGEAFRHGLLLRTGDVALWGSDGFWENFGSDEEIAALIEDCETIEEAIELLTREAHLRMDALAKARQTMAPQSKFPVPFYYKGALYLHRYVLDSSGRKVDLKMTRHTGGPLWIDDSGNIYEDEIGGNAVAHFKTDNFSLGGYLHHPESMDLDEAMKSVSQELKGAIARLATALHGEDRTSEVLRGMTQVLPRPGRLVRVQDRRADLIRTVTMEKGPELLREMLDRKHDGRYKEWNIIFAEEGDQLTVRIADAWDPRAALAGNPKDNQFGWMFVLREIGIKHDQLAKGKPCYFAGTVKVVGDPDDFKLVLCNDSGAYGRDIRIYPKKIETLQRVLSRLLGIRPDQVQFVPAF